MDLENLTPGMRQFTQVKEEYPDCLVFFRMGDFYETFYDDAKTASRELDITLTSRGKGDKKAPLAGIPFHALEPYLAKLIRKGYKVAIVEQLEDPKKAKGLVKRGVVRIVTPGTVIEAAMLDESTNNFIMAVLSNDEKYALSFCDISTGEFLVGEFKDLDDAINQIVKFSPSECIMPLSLKVNGELVDRLRKLNVFVNTYDERYFNFEKANSKLKNHFDVINLRGFGIDSDLSVCVSGALLSYLQETQFNDLNYINKIKNIDAKNVMVLDSVTLRNLEVIKNIREGTSKGSLLDVIDNTVTSLGTRLIKKWLKEPLMDVQLIQERLDAVEVFVNNIVMKDELVALLKQFNDTERLISRINYGNANARDLIALKNSLKLIPLIKDKLVCKNGLLKDFRLNSVDDVVNLVENSIRDEPPLSIRDGDLIKLDYHPELKTLHDIKKNGKSYILELENNEKSKTGIKSLRIGFNKVFGYYIEVSRSNLHLVPKDYIRKQTTVNGERYITEDLKEQESKILGADEKIKALEYELFQEVIKKITDYTLDIQEIGKEIAILDVILGFSNAALNGNYSKPLVDDFNVIELKESRHPVIESIEPNFVPNDIRIETGEIMLITGPNMSGKCIIADSMVFSNKGLVTVSSLKPKSIKPRQFLPFKLRICGYTGPEVTSHFYCDGLQSTIRIKTKRGYEIEGTLNHPILVRSKNENECWKKLKDIKLHDFIPIQRKINLWGNKITISKKIVNSIKNYNYNNHVLKCNIPEKIDTDLAYLIGLIIGDGTLTKKSCILFSNIDQQLIDEFYRIVKKEFGYNVKEKGNCKDYIISSVQIRLFFEKMGMGYVKSLEKEVPPLILRAPKRIVQAFLSGLFDTDGYADRKYGNPSLSTSSLKLAKQVQLLLLNMGIISSLKPKRTKRNMNYLVSIYGENAILFYKRVGFKLKRKQQREILISKLRMPNYGIPYMHNLLKIIQKRIVLKQNKKISLKKVKRVNSIFYTYIPSNRNISYKKLKELIDYCILNEIDCRELILIFEKDYFYDPIESIEQTMTRKEVYDFTVPKSHSFVANGFINHNSSLMRQVALNVLLAQIGSYVACSSAHIGVVDRIFTRVGAHDDLVMGQSTFMVEMSETANILNNATSRSLIILDEIGRGTSTFDGVAIAWSVAEYIYNKIKAKTLFATHYHVLNKLSLEFARIRNYNLAVKESRDNIVFLRQLIEGGTDKSYGVHVAKLAGLPFEVVQRATDLQQVFEAEDKMVKKVKGEKVIEQKTLL